MDLFMIAYHSRYLKERRAEAAGDWRTVDRWAANEGVKREKDNFTPFRLDFHRTGANSSLRGEPVASFAVEHADRRVAARNGRFLQRARFVSIWLTVVLCRLLRPRRLPAECRQ